MSGHTWRLIDWFRDNRGRSQTRLAINSNLGPQVDIYRLLDSTEGMDVEIYTSQEAVGKQAEYIRDGLDYPLWRQNVMALLDAGRTVHVMCTINALCLTTLPRLLNELVEWKRTYGRDRVNFTLNILRFPSFQSPLVLPDHLREQFKGDLTQWLVDHRGYSYMQEHEINHTQRLIDYLDVVKTPHSDAFEMPKLHNDFREFYRQYDQRRGRDFAEYFPELKEWYQSL
jgi:hypothetical protein